MSASERPSTVLPSLFGLPIAASGLRKRGPRKPGRIEIGGYTSGAVAYTFETLVPADLPDNSALLMMVHGCKTTAEQQRRTNLLDPIARRGGFVGHYVDSRPLNRL
ncbi:hypothetical protein ACFYUD_11700 [Nocardia tengchongensis]|uniref:hypothetical protein n=1 Tax=Nocardia tengchongensis TaxID=2055889 RepID=UPI0036CF716C